MGITPILWVLLQSSNPPYGYYPNKLTLPMGITPPISRTLPMGITPIS